jgi:DNA-directed RNA polymerase subunit RPC12/RpoP
MNITFACHACQSTVRHELGANSDVLACPRCGQQISIPRGAIRDGSVARCVVCPSRDLYVRKDVPQRLGVGIVVAGILASSIAWGYHAVAWTFGILFATALVDFVLFFVVGDSLMCYRCGAQYRGASEMESHGAFNLETHERNRQASARLAESSAARSHRVT